MLYEIFYIGLLYICIGLLSLRNIQYVTNHPGLQTRTERVIVAQNIENIFFCNSGYSGHTPTNRLLADLFVTWFQVSLGRLILLVSGSAQFITVLGSIPMLLTCRIRPAVYLWICYITVISQYTRWLNFLNSYSF